MTAAGRRRPIDRVEELAAELYGRGAAVSVDKGEGGACVVTVWDPGGAPVLSSTERTKAGAVAALRSRLEEGRGP